MELDDGAASRRDVEEGLRVDVDDTMDRVSGSRSRFERVESLVRRRRLSSSLLLLEAAELPVNLLHMVVDVAQGVWVRCY